jgi:aminopeptidase N
VTVSISADRPLMFATTGEQVGQTNRTRYFEAAHVRDFAFAAAPDYQVSTTTSGDTTIRVFHRSGFPASATLTAARRALERMEPLVGQYPYPTYDIAQTAGGYGMESPGLTWIPTGTGTGNLSYLVAHETAHQWFYGLVGGNQADEPFTDEAMADFLGRYVLGLRRASRCSTARLDLSIYRYSSGCYYEVIYIQGGNFLDDLRKKIGPTAFWGAIGTYIAENRFEIAPTKTLLDTLDAATSLDLRPTYGPRFPRLY